MRLIYALFIIIVLLVSSTLFAQPKEIIVEGTYNMGDGETPNAAESHAVLKAKQIAIEQAGIYIETFSMVKDLTLTQDEIQVLSSGLMEVEILEKKRTIKDNSINFWVKIKAKVNPDNMEEMAERVKEKSVVENYKRIQNAYAKSEKEIQDLKRMLAEAKDEKKKKQVEANIKDAEKLIMALDRLERGFQYDAKKEYDKAIEAYTSSIALYPKMDTTYLLRGDAYFNLNKYDLAIDDFTAFITLNSNKANGYVGRGKTYNMQGQYDKAIDNFNEAKATNPDDTLIYVIYLGRGIAYVKKGQWIKSVEDFNNAVAIQPKNPLSYRARGGMRLVSGNIKEAVSDFQIACGMNDKAACNTVQELLLKSRAE